jgi:hypothetical protein
MVPTTWKALGKAGPGEKKKNKNKNSRPYLKNKEKRAGGMAQVVEQIQA